VEKIGERFREKWFWEEWSGHFRSSQEKSTGACSHKFLRRKTGNHTGSLAMRPGRRNQPVRFEKGEKPGVPKKEGIWSLAAKQSLKKGGRAGRQSKNVSGDPGKSELAFVREKESRLH